MSTGSDSGGVATIVFVDVEGSTALIERAGDRAGTDAVQLQLAVVRQRLAEYEGREVKSLGDGLMLAFDSPRRAVSFALAAQRSLADSAPRVRCGIHTGEVIDLRADLIGGAVNAAARITGRASGGEVLVSDVVRQLVGATMGIRFVDRGRVSLKGFAERWHLWAAESPTSASSSVGTVGRIEELALLRRLVTSTIAGAGQVVLVEGEAGIGKTHLAREVSAFAASAGMHVHTVVADEVTRRPGALAHSLLADAELPGPARDRLRDLLFGSARGDPADLSYAITEASIDAAEAIAGTHAALVVFEDAQWADDLSLTILVALVRRVSLSRFSVVVTSRPSPRPVLLHRLTEVIASMSGRHLHLGALDDTDVRELSRMLLGATPGVLLGERVRATAGNPLYVGELLRSLDDEGLLHTQDGIVDVRGVELPTSLRDTLLRRLAWLPPDVLELLRVASLLGSTFTLGDLATIASRSVIDVAAVLHEASIAGLIIGDGDRLTFRHDLIREAVYDAMLPAIRRDLHRAAAMALSITGAPTQVVARQFARGARSGDLDAVDWLTRAADETVPLAPRDAIGLYEEALALTPALWPGKGRIEAKMVEPLAWCGRYERAEELATAILASSPDPEVEFAVLRGMSAVYGNSGRIADAVAVIERACAVPGAPIAESIRLSSMAAQLQHLTGVLDETATRVIGERTLAHGIETNDHTTQCIALQVLASVDSVNGYGAAAKDRLFRAIALYTSGRVRHTSYLIPDSFYAGSLIELDDIDGARSAVAEARVRYERNGALSQLPMSYMLGAYLEYLAGNNADADAELDAGLAVTEDTGNLNFVLYLHAMKARLALRRGESAKAEQHLASGIAHFTAAGSLFGADWLFDAQTNWLIASGDHLGALGVAELVWSQTGSIRHFYGSRERAITLVRLAVRLGRDDLAEEVTTSAEEGRERSPAISAAATALQCRAMTERDPARMLAAVDLWRTVPTFPPLASACEDAAALLIAVDRKPEAAAILDEAAAIHARSGATADNARVHAIVGTLGRRPRQARAQRPTFGWDALSPTEFSISKLIASGLANPEIGTRLYISRRTVESHLGHIFRKLGCANRSQLAAEFTRQHPDHLPPS